MNKNILDKKIIRISIIAFLLVVIGFSVFLLAREVVYKKRLSAIQSQLNKRYKIEKPDGSLFGEILTSEIREGTNPLIKYTAHLFISSPQVFRNAMCNYEECRERFFYKYVAGIFSDNKLVGQVAKVSPIYCNVPEQNKFPTSFQADDYKCEDQDLVGKYPTELFLVSLEVISSSLIDLNKAEIRLYPVGTADFITNISAYPTDHEINFENAKKSIIEKGDEFMPAFKSEISVVDEKSITMLKSTSYGKENLATKS